jgi:hypothetical protein
MLLLWWCHVSKDGVAPRAKMNQQRSRRFKAIKESKEKAEKEAEIVQEMIRMGKEIPQKEDKPHVRALPPHPLMRATLTTHLSHIIRFPFSSLLFSSSVRLKHDHARHAFHGQGGAVASILHPGAPAYRSRVEGRTFSCETSSRLLSVAFRPGAMLIRVFFFFFWRSAQGDPVRRQRTRRGRAQDHGLHPISALSTRVRAEHFARPLWIGILPL